jgi:chemotaxis protein MotB
MKDSMSGMKDSVKTGYSAPLDMKAKPPHYLDDSARRATADQAGSLRDLEGRLAKLQDANRDLARDRDGLQGQADDLRRKLADADRRVADAQGQAKGKSDMSGELDRLRAERDRLVAALADRETALTTAKSDLGRTKGTLDTTEAERARLAALMADRDGALAKANGDRERLAAMLAEKDPAIVGMKSEQGQLRAQLQAAEAERARLAALLAERDAALASAATDRERLKGMMTADADKAKLADALSAREAELAKASAEADRLRAVLAAAEAEKSRLAAEHSKLMHTAALMKAKFDLMEALKPQIEKGNIMVRQEKAGQVEVRLADRLMFDSGKDGLKSEGGAVLKQVGAILKDVPGAQITVEGHTDNVPVTSKLKEKFLSNTELSQARAINAAKFLEEAGVAKDRMHSVGKGEADPIADNKSLDGRKKNRRVEIVITQTEPS